MILTNDFISFFHFLIKKNIKNSAAIVSFGDESTVVISTNATGAGNQGYIGSLWLGNDWLFL